VGRSRVLAWLLARPCPVCFTLLASCPVVALCPYTTLFRSLPRVLAVKVTRQVLEVVPGVSVQGLGATAELEPDGRVETTRLTMPRGALLGALSVSATVTVQERGLLAGVEAGQSSVVEVVRAVTMTVSLPLLVACTEVGSGFFPYATLFRSRVLAVKVTRQVLEVVPGVSVQGLGATAELEPDGLVRSEKRRVGRGGSLGAVSVSATVTVQERVLLAGVEAGQSSVVDVVRAVTMTVSLPLLVACTEVGAWL